MLKITEEILLLFNGNIKIVIINKRYGNIYDKVRKN